MTHQKSTASKDFSRLQPNLLPPDRNGHPGKSCPINDTFTHFSMVGVYETRKGLKFVHITSKKLEGKYTVLIFMDNKLTPIEAEEWKEFSDMLDQFKKVGAQVMGVCTDSHVTIRTMVMQSQNLQGIKFPIISDRDGDFSRALGVLKLKNGEFGAARALILLDRDVEVVHLSLHNEKTRSRPTDILELINQLENNSPSSSSSSEAAVSSSGSVHPSHPPSSKNDRSTSEKQVSDHPESRKSSQSENHVSKNPESMKPSSDISSSTVDTSKIKDIPDNAALESKKKEAKDN